MVYKDLSAPIRKVLTSKLSGKRKFELFGAMFDGTTPEFYYARSVKNGITVYDEFTPVEVGNI